MPRERKRRRQDELERDEAHIDRHQVRRLGQERCGQIADIGVLERDHVGARAQFRMQLTASDIDCVDLPRPALEQHLGEAAGRGADIESNPPRRIEAEMIERGRKLHTAARHPWMIASLERQPRV